MSFVLTETQKKEIRKQEKKMKDKKEHIKLSVFLFLNAKAIISLISKGLGVDIVILKI